jgi:putative ABC transport system permease protein
MFTSILRDLRYALRSLGRNPGFACVSVLALALGIGANSAIFTVVNSVLLQPLRFQKPEQLLLVRERNLKAGFPEFSLSPGNYLGYRDQNHSFSGIAAFGQLGFNLAGGAEPERLRGTQATPDFFDVLGRKPSLSAFICVHQRPFCSLIAPPAWYELRTSGPDSTCAKPISSPAMRNSSNSRGAT